MLTLQGASETIRVVSDNTATLDVYASFTDDVAGTITTKGPQGTAISTATTTPVVAAPGASNRRAISHLIIENKSGATTANPIVQWFDGTNAFQLIQTSLAPGESLHYEDGDGWRVCSADGSVKQTTSGPGQFLRRTIYTTGSAATHTFLAATRAVRAIGLACGGGGGGCSSSASNCAVGGGGAAGGLFDVLVTGTAFSTGTYTVSATGGTAGANTGGTGGTGADTTLVIGATTYTAKGGLGGVGQTFGTAAAAVLGGAGVVSTNANINGAGAPGGWAYRVSGTVGVSGAGGSSIYGSGGNARNTQGAGNAAIGFGAGGGGGCALSAAVTGGAGGPGLLIIEEYS